MKFLEVFDKDMKRTGYLTHAYEIERRRRLNSDYELSFLVPMTSDDFREKITLKGHVMDERGQYYVINGRSRVRNGRQLTAQIMCTHIMFKLNEFKIPYDQYVEEMYGIPVSVLLARITNATGGLFTFQIEDDFGLRDVKDWGRTTALEALNSLVEKYDMEVRPDNYVIHLRKQIGSDNGYQYRIKKDIVNDQFKDEASNLVTRLYVTMKDGRTWIGQPASILTDEERARLEAVPGAIVNGVLRSNFLISQYAGTWASQDVPFYDGEYSNQDIEDPIELLKDAREQLSKKEIPDFEVSVDTADLYKLDGTIPPADLGDIVYVHDPDMSLKNFRARVTELTEYPLAMDKHSKATIANHLRPDMDDITADLNKAKNIVNNMMSGGRIRTDIFESFARQAVIDINNSKTELIYPPEGGILAQEKNNPLNQVRLTAAGLGISTDGWKSIRAAVTARGVVAESVIGQFGNFVSMLIGYGEDVVQINQNGISAGASSFSNAPFRLDMKGNLIANSLTANYANIEYSSFKNGAIVGSSINVGNGMFTVTSGGIMSAVGANFSGSITASTITGTNINGGTITGSLIRTAVSGRRVEIDTNGFRSYDSNGRTRIQIATTDDAAAAAIIFRDANGTSVGEINSYQNSGVLTMYGNSIIIGSNSTGNPIRMQGAVTFGGSVYGLDISDVSGLQNQLTELQNKIDTLQFTFNNHRHSVTTANHNHGNTQNLPNTGGGTFTTTTP